MKTYRLLLAAAAAAIALSFSGCSTVGGNPGSYIQRALDAALPPTFTGDAALGHRNAYFDFEIAAAGLAHNEHGWTWDSLQYKRNGRFSTGWIAVTPSK